MTFKHRISIVFGRFVASNGSAGSSASWLLLGAYAIYVRRVGCPFGCIICSSFEGVLSGAYGDGGLMQITHTHVYMCVFIYLYIDTYSIVIPQCTYISSSLHPSICSPVWGVLYWVHMRDMITE